MANIVVTGANRGIGLALVVAYRAKGHKVIGLCRESSEALESSGAKVISGIDVTRPETLTDLHDCVETIIGQGQGIDILINNAGLLCDESFGRLNYDTMVQQFEVNALGPLRITEALESTLANSAKVIFITSRMGSMADNGSGGRYGYRMSKAALNAAGVSLAQDFKERGFSVALLHPGYVQTDMVGGRGDIPPELAASRLMERIEQLTLDSSGSFWHSNGEMLPW
ncbi:SDR family oxidoreductase [Marinibactrum halimedae]|uniref:Short-chain dehydrogenase n=1 Tax=Marinibactrum halimedae TaxID=1444977 RepID=A0AA37TBU2_9GAMM|nr:SDR family oxidoreductase [Marinibactrum halimedae]MCD9461262.1 SDR family oxidoreductase [Marinibactrum halimedae]GLS26202.1 short-chain dehydrogenase [Marinibactrum halimedae]